MMAVRRQSPEQSLRKEDTLTKSYYMVKKLLPLRNSKVHCRIHNAPYANLSPHVHNAFNVSPF
jgi:hypothetical protein